MVSKGAVAKWNRGTICGFTKRRDVSAVLRFDFATASFYTIDKSLHIPKKYSAFP